VFVLMASGLLSLAVSMDTATSDMAGLGRYFRRCSIFCRAEIPPLKQMDGT